MQAVFLNILGPSPLCETLREVWSVGSGVNACSGQVEACSGAGQQISIFKNIHLKALANIS